VHRERLASNLDVFDFELSADEVVRLRERNEHYSSLGAALAYTV
jgi:diketogulonate reductase-like aldo/keto reductase